MPLRASCGHLEQQYLRAAPSSMVALAYVAIETWNVATVTEELNIKFYLIFN